MVDVKIERLLDLVKAKLGAVDARLEIGGNPPTAEEAAWHDFGDVRLVALFSEPIPNRELVQKRLTTFCTGFSDTVSNAVGHLSVGRGAEDPREQLDAELGMLSERAGANRAAVFDLNSEIIWGASRLGLKSEPEAPQILEQWVGELRSSYAADLRSSRGHVIRLSVRSEHECLAKMFGGIYVVSLYFDGVLSEPVAVGALLHAAGRIEKLVMALPPVEPPPGGKVVRLAARMRSV